MEILNCWQQSWINIWVTSKKCQQKCKELEYIWIKFFINSITTILIYSAHNDKLNPCSLNTELSNLEITEFCITRDPCIQPCILLIARNCMQRRNMQFAVPTWWTREECIQHSVRQLHYYSDSKPHNGDTLPSFLRSCHGLAVAALDKELTQREPNVDNAFRALRFNFSARYRNRWAISKLDYPDWVLVASNAVTIFCSSTFTY